MITIPTIRTQNIFVYACCLLCLTATLLTVPLSLHQLSTAGTTSMSFFMLITSGTLAWLLARGINKLTSPWVKSLYLLALAYISLGYTSSLFRPFEGWDTWQIYDMSRYILTDFGYMDMIRQHIVYSHYEMAFPPLTPFLMALINSVWDTGVMASGLIAYLFAILTFLFAIRLSIRLKLQAAVGITFLLFISMGYPALIHSGNTQVLGFFLMWLYGYVLFSEKKNLPWVLSLSAIAAVGVMNRFDFLPIALMTILLVPGLYALQQKSLFRNLLALVCSAGVVLLICSPWILYSIHHFDTFFVTDNGRRLINIPETRPSSYFPDNAPALTIWDDWKTWIGAFSQRCCIALHQLSIMLRICVPPMILAAFLCLISHAGKRPGKQINWSGSTMPFHFGHLCCPILLFALVLCGYEAAIIATGYEETRYHIPFSTFIALLLMIVVARSLQAHKRPLWLMSACTAFILALPAYSAMRELRAAAGALCHPASTQQFMTPEEEAMAAYLRQVQAGTVSMDSNPRFYALSGITTMFLSTSTASNIKESTLPDYIREFRVSHIYTTQEDKLRLMQQTLIVRDTPFPHLYEVSLKEDEE